MKTIITSILFFTMTLFVKAQMMRSDISLSDPFIMADSISKNYYMTGTSGELFKSSDLEIWRKQAWPLNTEDITWIGIDHTAPSPGLIWAPELYYKNGAYYNIVTFTNPNATTEGTTFPRRSIHILKSYKPEGPYEKIDNSDNLYLPASKMVIDGTLWEEDGHLYLVYCYEWVQAGDGAIEYIELKPDLTGTIGNPHHICKASDGRAWNTDAVTDGPFIFRTQTGRLGMIWTGWRSGIYVQSASYSDNGRLDGNWSHLPYPITPDNHGHGMLFRTFEGQLLMSIHSNRNIDLANQSFERHPVLFIVDDSGDELRTVMQYRHEYKIDNPANVVVLNAGFDYATSGWTCTSQAVNQKIASNQTGAITGNYYENWDSKSFIGDIYQELDLPNGTYRFTAAAFRSALISGATEDNDAVCIFANEAECQVTSSIPEYYSVTVHVKDGKLRFGIRSKKKNYQWMGIDNANVTYFGNKFVSAEEIDNNFYNEGAIYLQNKKNGKFLNVGNSWGTQAILSEHPLDLYPIKLPNGKFIFNTHIDNRGGNHYLGANGYADAATTEFTIEMIDSSTCTLKALGTLYWGATAGSDVISTNLISDQSEATHWRILRKSDLIAAFTDANAETPADATFLIKGANFGRNDTRIDKNWNGSYEQGGDVTNQCIQAPSESFNINQTITDIPNGVYELRVQGFYRHGSATAASNNRLQGTEKLQAYIYANDEQTPLMSIFEHQNHSSIPSTDADHTISGTIPSSLIGASAMFSSNLYKNKLLVKVTNRKLQLGVKKQTTLPASNWTVIDNFELYYLGAELPSSIENSKKPFDIEKTGIYDLSGRKIDANIHTITKPHIYIINGKKQLMP